MTGEGNGIYATAATNGKENAVLVVNIGARKTLSLDLCGRYFAYICKNGKRIVPVEMDPASFVLKKNEFVFFSTKALSIPE